MAAIDEYPDVVIHEIAKRLDYATIRSMKLANRRLHSALSDPLLWIDLCERDERVFPSREFRKSLADQARDASDENIVGQLDFERIWVKDPFRANLMDATPILATIGDMSWEYGWRFYHASYASLALEDPPIGTEPHPEIARCFSTSHVWGQRMITVDLVKEGLPEWMLDNVRPRIIVSEMAAPRVDCASVYHMHAQLLRADQEFDLGADSFRYIDVDFAPKTSSSVKFAKKTWPQWTEPARWERVEISFDNYPAGMRKICVVSRGKDLQHWRGNYGAKFANLGIRIELPEEARWLAESDFSDETTKAKKNPSSKLDLYSLLVFDLY